MRDSIKIGDSVSIQHEISPDDTASFKGEIVHEVCSTFVLAREVEWSSRQFMFQLCEDDEEGIGTSLTINHISPAFVGEVLEIIATVKGINENELICSYIASAGSRIIAEGTTGQKILKKVKIDKIFSKLGKDE